MNTKDRIKSNFSRYAAHYDAHSAVQDQAGSKLITAAGTREFKNILDIGCGTGNYTRLLRERFPSATIKAVDISPEMIEIARHKLQDREIEFATVDAETTTINESFDLITSNVCFQWFTNLDKAILKYKNAIRQGGTILFSMFGPLTFCELGRSLSQLYNKDVKISSAAFVDSDTLSASLGKNYSRVSVNEHISKETYSSLWQLLTMIKYTGTHGTGTQGTGINGQPFSKGRITELEKIYKERFNDITATYQIFYCRAERRD